MALINVQSSEFPLIREKQVVYVDKTDYFYRLIQAENSASSTFFLARPRRFGKSLMISTFKAIFQGRRDLFDGLAIAKTDYDWQPWPVLHFDLSTALGQRYEEIETSFNNMANSAFKAHPGFVASDSGKDNFTNVLEAYERAGKQVVLLIDEYDALICHTLDDPAKCEKVRQLVGNFYAVMKGHQAAIRFAMITGISKFASLAVFSGLNNIIDLTYDPDYATMLGYTQVELEANFGEHLDRRAQEMGLSKADFMAELARWFNGYRFSIDSEESVYNPVAIARTLASRSKYFEAQWTTTGRPSMLTTFLRRNELLELDFEKPIYAERADLEMASKLDNLAPITVLYQTGYLTLQDYNPRSKRYLLKVPDAEISEDLNAFLYELVVDDNILRRKTRLHVGLETLKPFLEQDLFDLYAQCVYGPTEKRIQEYNYQRILQVLFLSQGYEPVAEPVQASGKRADLVVKVFDLIYVFEFKTDGTTAEEALQQIKDRGYATPYLHDGRPIALVGLSFHKGQRELQGVAYELLPSLA